MAKRKSIGKSLRFEVFKRDSFTCQYCGRKAPDVVLEVDHINPVCEGGDNDILNLVTSCADCNRGKSGKKLSDNSTIEVQRKQLEELNERRNQLQMMNEWRDSLKALEEEQLDRIESMYSDFDVVFSPQDNITFARYIKKYGYEEVVTAVEISIDSYSRYGKDKMLNKVGGILYNRAKQKDDPNLKNVCSLVYLAKKQIPNINEYILKRELKRIVNDSNVEKIRKIILESKEWRDLVFHKDLYMNPFYEWE